MVRYLLKDGRSGVWHFSYTDNGSVNQNIMISIIQDLGDFIMSQKISAPVLLFMDGAKCHISLEIAQLKIQPILLHHKMTHPTQPLDLTYVQSFKTELQKEKEAWHLKNIGVSLSKYSIILLAHTVTERILEHKLTIIGNRFRSGGIFSWNPSAPN